MNDSRLQEEPVDVFRWQGLALWRLAAYHNHAWTAETTEEAVQDDWVQATTRAAAAVAAKLMPFYDSGVSPRGYPPVWPAVRHTTSGGWLSWEVTGRSSLTVTVWQARDGITRAALVGVISRDGRVRVTVTVTGPEQVSIAGDEPVLAYRGASVAHGGYFEACAAAVRGERISRQEGERRFVERFRADQARRPEAQEVTLLYANHREVRESYLADLEKELAWRQRAYTPGEAWKVARLDLSASQVADLQSKGIVLFEALSRSYLIGEPVKMYPIEPDTGRRYSEAAEPLLVRIPDRLAVHYIGQRWKKAPFPAQEVRGTVVDPATMRG